MMFHFFGVADEELVSYILFNLVHMEYSVIAYTSIYTSWISSIAILAYKIVFFLI